MREERLQKILAQAGLCSRRKAEEWIQAGRIFVNGKRVSELGSKANPFKDKITLNGKPLHTNSKKVYYLFYKPRNVMVTRHDPEGRPTIYDFLKNIPARVYPVGRLDFDSEGLLLLTNDGELTHKLTHPKSKVSKTYQVKVAGIPTEMDLEKMRKGVKLHWGITQPAQVQRTKQTEKNAWVTVTLTEGKQHQVKEIFKKAGFPVMKLRRVAIGPFKLGKLKPGEHKKVHARYHVPI